jgi:hypothetical protein
MAIAILAAAILAVLVALPLAELVLARRAHAHLCGIEAEPETVRTNGMGTVFLLMDFVRMEEGLTFARNVSYEEEDAVSLPPLFAVPANSNGEAAAQNG